MEMNLLNNLLIGTANLPDITEGVNWGSNIIEQVVLLVAIFLFAKFLIKLKIGQIIGAMVVGGIVWFGIRNTEKVFGWIEALLETL